MNTRIFDLESKLRLTREHADKYKLDLEEMTAQYDELNDYIKRSRFVSIEKKTEHEKFLQEEMVNEADIDDARVRQARLDYSALSDNLNDLSSEVKNQHNMSLTTTKMLQDKIIMNKKQSKFHSGLD